jgi:hypothetical protein
MLIKIAMQALRSYRKILSIIMFVSDNKANNPFINTFFGGGGSSQSPSIVNVSIVASAFASTSTLLKFVRFFCGFVVDWFVVN